MASESLDGSNLDHVSAVVERLAVLLSAGIPPAAAWRYLAETEVASSFASRVVHAVSVSGAEHPIGETIRETVEAELSAASSRARAVIGGAPHRRLQPVTKFELSAWRGLAAAWIVATESGAPLSQGLLDFAATLRALAQARRDASVALAGPRATAKLVLGLPVVGILFGIALGFDTLGTLVTTIPGLVCLVVGGSLLLAARAWNHRLVNRASPTDATPGLVLDLFAISVSGGASIDRARAAVSRSTQSCGIADLGREAEPVLALARRAGIPPGALLRREADRVRRDAKSDADRSAARLAVTLMMPLGICVLPAFMLVGVAPLMIAVLSSTVSTF